MSGPRVAQHVSNSCLRSSRNCSHGVWHPVGGGASIPLLSDLHPRRGVLTAPVGVPERMRAELPFSLGSESASRKRTPATPRIKNRHVRRLDLPADLRGQRSLAPGCYLRQQQIRMFGAPHGLVAPGPIKSPITIPRYLVFAVIASSAIIKGARRNDMARQIIL